MSHQHGLGNNGPEPTGLSEPDYGDDRMQKKSQNLTHAPDGIRLKKPNNSQQVRNSPTTLLVVHQIRVPQALPLPTVTECQRHFEHNRSAEMAGPPRKRVRIKVRGFDRSDTRNRH